VTCPDATSIDDNVIANTRVAYSVRPSRLIATPPARVSPGFVGSAIVRARVSVPSMYENSWTLFSPPPLEYNLEPSALHARPRNAFSTGTVFFTVQFARSTMLNDGFAMPLLVMIA